VPRTLTLLLLVLAALAGCTRGGQTQQTITVFAAASLTEAFRAIERAYELEHPEHDVELNFAGSQLLATQLLEGAPGLVFASADPVQLDRVGAERPLASRRGVATNRIVIVVPAGSAIMTVWDLADPGRRVVLAGEAVPAGRYARLALLGSPLDSVDLRGGVERNLVSNETDVRAVVAKVRLGEADAGMAYATDVLGDPQLELRELSPPFTVEPARYELAVIADGREQALRDAGMQFVEFVSSPTGQAILAAHGFGPP